jgi:hypothetical protein
MPLLHAGDLSMIQLTLLAYCAIGALALMVAFEGCAWLARHEVYLPRPLLFLMGTLPFLWFKIAMTGFIVSLWEG